MTERARADHGSTASGLHLHVSKLLVAAVIGATAATGALIVAILVEMPPPPPAPGPNGMPPPPPGLQSLVVFPIVTGLFVLAWLAVLVVFCRDQILQRIHDTRPVPAPDRQEIVDLFATLRTELAADRERELRELGERFAALTSEYGEQRETDGYLSGMRVATNAGPVEGTVRPIRRTPPLR
jgi:hypothetical protein